MKKYNIALWLLTMPFVTLSAQETHYHKSIRTDAENAKYGTVAADPNPNGGVYWSRVRNVDDVQIYHETPEDSIRRRANFKRLCQLAYDAFDAGDAQHTVVYGDSALKLRYHTPDLYYFMGVSYESLGLYKDAENSYKHAAKAGYMKVPDAYPAFRQRMKVREAEAKRLKKQQKSK